MQNVGSETRTWWQYRTTLSSFHKKLSWECLCMRVWVCKNLCECFQKQVKTVSFVCPRRPLSAFWFDYVERQRSEIKTGKAHQRDHLISMSLTWSMCLVLDSLSLLIRRHECIWLTDFRPYKCEQKLCMSVSASEPNTTTRYRHSVHPRFPPNVTRLRWMVI